MHVCMCVCVCVCVCVCTAANSAILLYVVAVCVGGSGVETQYNLLDVVCMHLRKYNVCACIHNCIHTHMSVSVIPHKS